MNETVENLGDELDKLNDKLVNNSWICRMFKRTDIGEVESIFAQGTELTTPHLSEVETRIPKPWVFFRMLCCSVLLYIAFIVVGELFENTKLIPAQFFIGAVAVPISFLCLFFELNILRNVSVFRVARFVLIGGMISLLYSLVLYQFQSTEDSIFWAGPVEEVGKLLAMIVIAEGSSRLKTSYVLGIIGMPFDWLIGQGVAPAAKYPWILNGILFGAAVGVGFAVFETMGYAFESLLFNGGIPVMHQTIFMRGILSPFGHIVWSAICGGAVWSACKGGAWRWTKLFHLKVILLVGLASILHGIWDVACSDPNAILWFLGLGATSWGVIILQIRAGIKQVKYKQIELEADWETRGILCPFCGCAYEYDPNLVGRKVQCSSCNEKFLFK